MTLLRDFSPDPVPATPVPSPARRRGLRATALVAASVLAAGLLGVVVGGGGTATAGAVGAGSYTETLTGRRPAAEGLRRDQHQPADLHHRRRARRRDPHQRLVVVADLEAQQLRGQRGPARPSAGVQGREQRARTVLHHHARDQRHRDRRGRVPLPVRRGRPRRDARTVGAGGQGRRLERLDGHRRLERRQPHHARHHRPRPAVQLLHGQRRHRAAHRRRARPPSGATPAPPSASRSAATTTSRTPRPARPGPSTAPASARRWPARGTSRWRCCPAAATGPPSPTPTAGTPTPTSPAPG